MVELKRTIRCSNCNSEANFFLSSDMGMSELQIQGRCPKCGNSMQVTFSIVESGTGSSPGHQSSSDSAFQESGLAGIDETMFTPDITSDAIKDLIDG
ncbi:MAG: hypothetical protein AABW86_01945 [Candidatus Micrarchaeota archaeon]